MSDKVTRDSMKPYPFQYPMQDRLWHGTHSIAKIMHQVERTDLLEGLFVGTTKSVCPR